MSSIQPHRTSLARPSDQELHDRQARALESALCAEFDGLIVWGRGGTTADGCAPALFYQSHFNGHGSAKQAS
jgi:hypothetical protein